MDEFTACKGEISESLSQNGQYTHMFNSDIVTKCHNPNVLEKVINQFISNGKKFELCLHTTAYGKSLRVTKPVGVKILD